MEGRVGLPKGTLLDGSYRIERIIGSGGFGITYAADDVKLGTKVAIKEYFPAEFGRRDDALSVRPTSEKQKATFDWGRDSFLQEARTLVRFKHPSIVRIARVFEAHSTAYMVMEFEEGKSFEVWLRDLGRPPNQEELDRIIGPLLEALAMMHAADFLHRDIAPDNIIIRANCTPVLLDFGAARRAIAEMSRAITGIVKAGYSPPEQYATDARLQGPWTDVYAFGATLYRAVAGERPEESTLRAIDDRMLRAASAGEGRYRPSFLATIDACLAIHHGDRPQSVSDLRLLLSTRSSLDPRASRSPAIAPAMQHKREGNRLQSPWQHDKRARNALLWLAVTCVAVLSIVVMALQRSGPAPLSAPLTGLETSFTVSPALTPVRPDSKFCSEIETVVANEWRCLKTKDTFRDCNDCPEMVVVPPAEFMMGSTTDEKGRRRDEGPQRKVRIATPLAVGKFEVTFAEWDACVADTGCRHRPLDKGWGRGRHPVINVSWDDITKEYLPWLSRKTGQRYRLLTEAEWEYAARAGTTTPFSTGQTITADQANFGIDLVNYTGQERSRRRTVEVGSFPPNAFGLYDMLGNASEWVQDVYNDSYAGAPTDGSAVTSGDCKYPLRVLRGGDWFTGPNSLRSASRWQTSPGNRWEGFRLARTLVPPGHKDALPPHVEIRCDAEPKEWGNGRPDDSVPHRQDRR